MKQSFREYVIGSLSSLGIVYRDNHLVKYYDKAGIADESIKGDLKCLIHDGMRIFNPLEYAKEILDNNIDTLDDDLLTYFDVLVHNYCQELKERSFERTFLEKLTFDRAVYIAHRVILYNFPFTSEVRLLPEGTNDTYKSKSVKTKATSELLLEIVNLVKDTCECAYGYVCEELLEEYEAKKVS